MCKDAAKVINEKGVDAAVAEISSKEGKFVAKRTDLFLAIAYLHLLADALTSVLAIFALLAGKYLGQQWMDPFMGLVGATLVVQWSWGLLHSSARRSQARCIQRSRPRYGFGTAAVDHQRGGFSRCRLREKDQASKGGDRQTT